MTKILFSNQSGQQLAANLELPEGTPLAYALFAHCFTCSKDALAAFRISKALTRHGIAVLRFDFTGLGNSQGDFANTNFSSNVSDLLSAAEFLRAKYAAPSLLIGHSLGGAAQLVAATSLPEVKAVVTIAAPSTLMQLEDLFTDKIGEIKEKGEAEVNLAGRKFNIKKQFIDDLSHDKVLKSVAALDKALLIFHSKQDKIVNIEHAYHLFNAATSSKSLITLESADHLLTNKDDAAYVAQLITDWSSRYIPLANNQAETGYKKETSQVVARETGQGKFTQEITAGNHVFLADEPLSAGGDDSGPNPYDLLLAALGACTSMTIRMYADFKKLPLEKVIVRLNHNKVYAADCEHCESEQSKIDHIDRIIELQGQLTNEQRAKLLEIANKCPVHKTLTSKVVINTQLIDH